MNRSNPYSAASEWTKAITQQEISYPPEYVIRIFKGNYPNLKMPKPTKGQKILDVGCGNGRNLPLFVQLGLETYGVEITNSIVEHLRSQMAPFNIKPNHIQVGNCSSLNFEDGYFDYVISWNSSYYMSLTKSSYSDHINELTRVLSPGGWLIISVPKATSFIFKGRSPSTREGYCIIDNDPFDGQRNGEEFKIFETKEEFKSFFNDSYNNICYADIEDDCFGFAYHWHIIVARKI